MVIFTTFASKNMSEVSTRIKQEAEATGVFGKVTSFNEDELTPELLSSDTFKIKKGFGHYSWKSDVIYQTLLEAEENDVVVYCDAGCTLSRCDEWNKLITLADTNDVISFRIYPKNYLWTRKSVINFFTNQIQSNWIDNHQCGANALIVKKTEAGVKFIAEWRDIMVNRLDLCGDVPQDEIKFEDPRFIENRYDQTILTALSYKYFEHGNVKFLWENFEGYNPFVKQAILATRRRKGREQWNSKSPKHILWRLYKTYLYYPFETILFKIKR